jgi:hypothetical protein
MLRTQVLKDQQGVPMGVFIPIKVWENVKIQYPDIDLAESVLPQWEKDFIDERLNVINRNPNRLHPIETLFDNL